MTYLNATIRLTFTLFCALLMACGSGSSGGSSSGTTTAGGTDGTQPVITHSAPVITSFANASFTVGTFGAMALTATGSPDPVVTVSGSLPSGVIFNSRTGVLSGTPASGSAGTYPLTIMAANGIAPNDYQNLLLTVSNSAVTGGVKIYGWVFKDGAGFSGVTVQVSDAVGRTLHATTSDTGYYEFVNMTNGIYTLTSSYPGFSFEGMYLDGQSVHAASTTITVNSASAQAMTGANCFTGKTGFSLTGNLLTTDGTPACNAQTDAIYLFKPDGTYVGASYCGNGGSYYFYGIPNGSYYLTPALSDITFVPPSVGIAVESGNQSGLILRGIATPGNQLSVRVVTASGVGVSNQLVTLTPSGIGPATLRTDPWGWITFKGLTYGTYTISGAGLSPSSKTVTVSYPNYPVPAVQFTYVP